MRLDLRRFAWLGLVGLAVVTSEAQAGFVVTNLVSDIATPGFSANVDANLKNPWGVSFAPTGPFWVSDQATNLATLYNGSGVPLALKVSTPTAASGPNGPTGQVWNGNSADFHLSNGNAASFLFANLNGQITAWNGGLGTSGTVPSQVVVSGTGAVYTGLAIGQVGSDNVLYAADARGNKVDVYNSTFANLNTTSFAGKFTDPNLASQGFRVFNVQTIGGNVYVTYSAGVNAATGGGAVAVYDLNGTLIRDFSNGSGGPLEDPWGVTLAPSSFGKFGGDLLVGNKEAGTINAFDPVSGAFLGLVATIQNSDPTATNAGLWTLTFGNGGNGGRTDTLYAFAGINNEADGLIASVSSVPEPGSITLMGIGGVLATLAYRRRARQTA